MTDPGADQHVTAADLDRMRRQPIYQINARVYDLPQKIVTHTLLAQGYQRYKVKLVTDEEQTLHATVWARHADQIETLYMGRGMLAVVVERLPIAPFRGQQFPDGTVVGDVILIDESEDECDG